jgi:hypothetical protein
LENPIEWSKDGIQKRFDQFLILRAQAIGGYSDLEQAFCSCLAHFAGTSGLVAATIYFRVSAARSRSEIIDKLKRQKLGVIFTGYWDSALALGRQLDEDRNKIVHWSVAAAIFHSEDDKPYFDVALKPPNYWVWSEGSDEIFSEELDRFSARCEFLCRSLLMLLDFLDGKIEGPAHETWREIFQQQLVYPPPPDHPLSQRTKVRTYQPESSGR